MAVRWSRLALPVALAAAAAAPAYAVDLPSVILIPGDAAVITLDDGGRASPPERSKAAWTSYDLHVARELAGMTPPDAPVTQAMPMHAPEGMSPDPIPPGEVRFRFFAFAGHSLLVVENGRGRALRYRARMTTNGRSEHTDVCIVLARSPSYEHWPFPVQRLELTGFKFIDWPPGRLPSCE